MKNIKTKGIIILIISIIAFIIGVGGIIVNSKDKGESVVNTTPNLYEVNNSFRASSPVKIYPPYQVNIYGIIENRSNKEVKDVTIKVYYSDTDWKRHEAIIPSFDIDANSEYIIDYDLDNQNHRGFYVEKVEYKVGNGNYKALKGFSSAATSSKTNEKLLRILPFIIILIFSLPGIFIGVVFTTFNMPEAEHISDVFKPSVRKNIVKCQYCGTNNKHGVFKCSSCGASIEYDNSQS